IGRCGDEETEGRRRLLRAVSEHVDELAARCGAGGDDQDLLGLGTHVALACGGHLRIAGRPWFDPTVATLAPESGPSMRVARGFASRLTPTALCDYLSGIRNPCTYISQTSATSRNQRRIRTFPSQRAGTRVRA